jgi:predicted DNA-binding transcriptional regulator YafY
MPKSHYIQFVKSAFRENGTWTAGALAERMECSERTVRRCMDHLRDHEKWPIEAGKAGYFLREPSLAETRITAPQEVAALAMVHEALRLLGVSKLALEIRGELAKVCRRSEALGEIRWDELGEVIEQRTASGEVSLNYAIHGKLTLAILQQQVVEIRYRRLEEDHDFSRRVFPLRLICRDSCWYLAAWDLKSEDQRTYALPRISQVTVQPTPEGFVVPEFEDRYQHAFGIWTPYEDDGSLYEVCVELSGYWARIARERCWHPSQRLEDLAPDRVRVHFRLSELVEVKSWVLGFGGAATVIAPEELRELVGEEVEAMKLNLQTMNPPDAIHPDDAKR